MKARHLLVTIAALAAAACGLAADRPAARADSRITVRFVDPESFTDVRDTYMSASSSYRDSVLEELRGFLVDKAEAALRPGLQLEINVTNVDLAGEFEPWNFNPPHDQVRVVKEVYPVRINLNFRLTDSTGAVLASGERRLNDFGRIAAVFPPSDPLRYEKEVLRSWMAGEFRDYRK